MDLFIYYQVKHADAEPLQAAVLTLQATLRTQHGVAGQLKRRPQERDGRQTWMEVYQGVADDFPATLDAAVASAGLSTWTDGARHTEVFMDLLPCA